MCRLTVPPRVGRDLWNQVPRCHLGQNPELQKAHTQHKDESDIRRDVCARVEKKKQETNAAHSLHGQIPAERRLKRKCFLSSVRPADFSAKVICCSEWQHRQNLAPLNCVVNLDESLAKGNTSPWAAWRCINRLRTGVACIKEQHKR